MKLIERATLIIFSDVILVLSIIACVLIFGWIDFDFASSLLHKALTSQMPSQIILAVSMVFILLAIRCIFFSTSEKEERYKQGVLLENEQGKLMISEETLQNIVTSVVKGFESAEDVSSSVRLDKENNLIIYANLIVKPNAVIKDLSSNIQNKVKATIKQSTDLDVKEVNIKVKNIAPKSKETN